MSRLPEQPVNLPPVEKEYRRSIVLDILGTAQDEMARRRGGYRIFDGDGFNGLQPEELATLANELLDTPNIVAAYDLMASRPRDGNGSYYDRIIHPQHTRSLKAIQSALDTLFPHTKVEHALDVAAGTGESSVILATHAKRVTAIDISPGMLEVAKRKLKKLVDKLQISGFSTKVMDALQLDFPNESFDVVMDNAFFAYLDP